MSQCFVTVFLGPVNSETLEKEARAEDACRGRSIPKGETSAQSGRG